MNDIDLMVNQLRAVAAQAGGGVSASAANGLTQVATQAPSQDFAMLLQSAVDEVNKTQLDARQLSSQFEAGNAEVNLQDVVLSLQKASLSFQTMVQVRNKLVSAYQEVMNMQV
ncbi:MAG: flagellar hook-basal body complex protein FliE [Hydrogenophilales bacterium CG17_big_fil_post_rev_8_21_14_2_50_63_12]|nr:MAG: flagellar hook-basal body complex protein FliE [Hydrogenophilales bacterium CG17_big_fil_post_rev_8_21_14_2_50_63_12]PIX97395.1 MAG: flagellar hook-basal body complex protein FliE [Hydrogenophilales bacterium CG_4_10_14_3_um_filter_63_21]PJB06280.1 MAG: flagellar hook-basal body complex protein FliE [Hydrogenophilales bacterium CG_4_9_14_3_um_filter_63_34]